MTDRETATIPNPFRWNHQAICELLDLPPEYTTGMSCIAEGGERSFATLEVTLRRSLTAEEFEAIVEARRP